jgi:prefoldin beta subunit
MSTSFEQKDIRELQVLDHNLQQLAMQKQSLQLELNETLNALTEIDKTSDEVYRVIGPAMMRVDKKALRKELEERKKLLMMRIESFEKQESMIESKLIAMQKLHAASEDKQNSNKASR